MDETRETTPNEPGPRGWVECGKPMDIPGPVPVLCERPRDHRGRCSVQWNEDDERADQAVRELRKLRAALHDEHEDRKAAEALVAKLRGLADDEEHAWRWAGDGDDDLESMGHDMAVVITAGDLRGLIESARRSAQGEHRFTLDEAGRVAHDGYHDDPAERWDALDESDQSAWGLAALAVQRWLREAGARDEPDIRTIGLDTPAPLHLVLDVLTEGVGLLLDGLGWDGAYTVDGSGDHNDSYFREAMRAGLAYLRGEPITQETMTTPAHPDAARVYTNAIKPPSAPQGGPDAWGSWARDLLARCRRAENSIREDFDPEGALGRQPEVAPDITGDELRERIEAWALGNLSARRAALQCHRALELERKKPVPEFASESATVQAISGGGMVLKSGRFRLPLTRDAATATCEAMRGLLAASPSQGGPEGELRELLRCAQHHVPRDWPQCNEFLDRALRVLGHDFAHSGSATLAAPQGAGPGLSEREEGRREGRAELAREMREALAVTDGPVTDEYLESLSAMLAAAPGLQRELSALSRAQRRAHALADTVIAAPPSAPQGGPDAERWRRLVGLLADCDMKVAEPEQVAQAMQELTTCLIANAERRKALEAASPPHGKPPCPSPAEETLETLVHWHEQGSPIGVSWWADARRVLDLLKLQRDRARARTHAALHGAPGASPAATSSPATPAERDCTCTGSCKGADGLAPGWRCVLEPSTTAAALHGARAPEVDPASPLSKAATDLLANLPMLQSDIDDWDAMAELQARNLVEYDMLGGSVWYPKQAATYQVATSSPAAPDGREHELKTCPPYFEGVVDGTKTFEVRREDRSFAVGNVLMLREWDPKTERYTGRTTRRRITYLMRGGRFGLERGHVVLGLAPEESSSPGPDEAESIAAKIERMVWIFPTKDDRRDEVRALAKRIRALDPPHRGEGSIEARGLNSARAAIRLLARRARLPDDAAPREVVHHYLAMAHANSSARQGSEAEDRSEPPPGYDVREDEDGGWYWSVIIHRSRYAVEDYCPNRETAVAFCWAHRDAVLASARGEQGDVQRLTAERNAAEARESEALYRAGVAERRAEKAERLADAHQRMTQPTATSSPAALMRGDLVNVTIKARVNGEGVGGTVSVIAEEPAGGVLWVPSAWIAGQATLACPTCASVDVDVDNVGDGARALCMTCGFEWAPAEPPPVGWERVLEWLDKEATRAADGVATSADRGDDLAAAHLGGRAKAWRAAYDFIREAARTQGGGHG